MQCCYYQNSLSLLYHICISLVDWCERWGHPVQLALTDALSLVYLELCALTQEPIDRRKPEWWLSLFCCWRFSERWLRGAVLPDCRYYSHDFVYPGQLLWCFVASLNGCDESYWGSNQWCLGVTCLAASERSLAYCLLTSSHCVNDHRRQWRSSAPYFAGRRRSDGRYTRR